MSKKWPGGIITPTPATPSGPYQDGAAPGIWTLSQQAYWQKQGLWPIAGNINTANVALFGGGQDTVGLTNVVNYVSIPTTGNSSSFGSLTQARRYLAACASTTRGIFAGGDSPLSSLISYTTLSTTGSFSTFGNLGNTMSAGSACNSSTRGIITRDDDIFYITMATTGNSSDFGNFGVAIDFNASCSSPTRGIFAGGENNTLSIKYVTIATTGSVATFGTTTLLQQAAACSSSTRGIIAGGTSGGGETVNTILYVTLATTGNSQTFGQLTGTFNQFSAASNSTRGVFAGGLANYPSNNNSNVIQYITIATTGNATDFGDLISQTYGLAGCSGGNGGVQ